MFDPATIIAAILGAPPKAQPPSFVPDVARRQAAMQTRVHQEFRMPGPPRRQAVPQAVTPPPRLLSCGRCALPLDSCCCARR